MRRSKLWRSVCQAVVLLVWSSIVTAMSDSDGEGGVAQTSSSVYMQLASEYLKSFDVLSGNEERVDYARVTKPELDDPLLSDAEKSKLTLHMFSQCAPDREDHAKSVSFSKSAWKDLELFCGSGKAATHLFSKVNKTQTVFGEVVLARMLAEPTYEPTRLLGRQHLVEHLLADKERFEHIERKLAVFAGIQNFLLSFWTEIDDINAKFVNKFFFKLNSMRQCNKDHIMLEGSVRLLQFGGLCNMLMYPIATFFQELYYGTKERTLGNRGDIVQKVQEKYFAKPAISKLIGAMGKQKTNRRFVQMAQSPLTLSSIVKTVPQAFMRMMTLRELRMVLFGNTKDGNIVRGNGAFRSVLQVYWLLMWGISVYLSLPVQKQDTAITQYLHGRLSNVATSVQLLRSVHEDIMADSVLHSNLTLSGNLSIFFNDCAKNSGDLRKLFELLDSPTFQHDSLSQYSLLGKVFAAYILMLEVKNYFVLALESLGELDAHMSIARLYKSFQGSRTPYCFPKFVQAGAPSARLEDFWNPFIDSDNVVVNTLSLGVEHASSGIVTGPNAGGKSTMLKSVLINFLLAQTLGIAPSRSLAFTPFARFGSYMNIVDDISSGNSLFKAEVLRAKQLIKEIKSLTPGQFSFTIMDEMFSGTTPQQGEAASYGFAKTVSACKNSLSMMATHFMKLTYLEDDTSGVCKNYCVGVKKLSDGTLKYPFKLEQGVANQNTAFDILSHEGVLEPAFVKRITTYTRMFNTAAA